MIAADASVLNCYCWAFLCISLLKHIEHIEEIDCYCSNMISIGAESKWLLAYVCLLALGLAIQQVTCGKIEVVEKEKLKDPDRVRKPTLSPNMEKMLILQRCVESKGSAEDLPLLSTYISDEVLFNGIEQFLELEMGLVFADHVEQLEEKEIEQALWEEVIMPCKAILSDLGQWWLIVFKHQQLRASQDKQWLVLTNICKFTIISIEPNWKETIAKKFRDFPAKFIADYQAKHRINKNPKTIEEIIETLKSLVIPGQQIERIESLARFVKESSKSEIVDQLHKLPSLSYESIITALVEYTKLYHSGVRSLNLFVESIYRSVVVPCQSVGEVLEKWWADNRLKENLEQRQIDWLLVRQVCKGLSNLSSENSEAETSEWMIEAHKRFLSEL